MIKRLSIIGICGIFMLVTSCATIFTGAKRKVLFESDPSGAQVLVNGFEKGNTPVQIKVKAEDRIDIKLDNYKERVLIMDSKFNLVSILNGISIIGWGVDALSGSLKRVDTKYVKVTLDPTDKTAFLNYMQNAEIVNVNVDEENKLIETIVILK